MELCLNANFGQPFFHRGEARDKVSKAPAKHELALEFALLRMAAVVDVAVFLTFAPLSSPPHVLAGGDVSLAYYDGCRQLRRDVPEMFQVHTRKT